MNSESLLGIDLGGTKVAVGRVDGETLSGISYELIPAKSKNPDDVINVVIETAEKLFDENIKGIGIGIPGLVDREKGIVSDVQNIPSWTEVHLREILENRFGVPVYLDNDANCYALGEAKFGSGRGVDDFVGLTLGTGMGAGIIKNGHLISDVHGASGEFGNIIYLNSIYEDYCSGKFFMNNYGIKGEDMAKSAEENDPLALKAFEEFGKHLGNAIKTIKFAVDPEKVIIGGSVAKSHKYYEVSMWKTLLDFPLPQAMKDFEVIFSDVKNIAILGAASLYYDRNKINKEVEEVVK